MPLTLVFPPAPSAAFLWAASPATHQAGGSGGQVDFPPLSENSGNIPDNLDESRLFLKPIKPVYPATTYCLTPTLTLPLALHPFCFSNCASPARAPTLSGSHACPPYEAFRPLPRPQMRVVCRPSRTCHPPATPASRPPRLAQRLAHSGSR